MSSANPPRVFGALLFLLGLALAGGGLHLNFIADSGGNYFMVIGVLLMSSGALIFFGQALAILVYALALLVIWGWSFHETDGEWALFIPRVAMPTLIGLYVFSSRIRGRLV